MSRFGGFKVVLTGDEALVSHYYNTYLGFASGMPMDLLPTYLGRLLFPTKSDKYGRMKSSQLGLCRIEASLINSGLPKDQVAIVDPRKLRRAVGPETKVIGLGVLDPLGVNYGTAIIRSVLKLMGIRTRLQSYMSWATIKILRHPSVTKYRPTVIVGGQGAWELIDSGLQRRLGIACIVEGEGELVAPKLFMWALRGDPLPNYVRGAPVPPDKIPPILTPSRGIVEVTRGCGRGCRFCNPTLLAFRTLPKPLILRDVLTNIRGGETHISLHSEDFLRYGSTGLTPNHEKVLDLVTSVVKMPSVESVSIDFVTASTVMVAPKLVKEVANLLNVSPSNPSVVQMGIESASPRLISMLAPGKPKPFSAEEWPEIVEEAVALLNDCGWWVCTTIIVNTPYETPEDIERNIELVERLRRYNVWIFPLPFIPSGSLRKTKRLRWEELLPKDRNLELIALTAMDTFDKLTKAPGLVVGRAPLPLRWLLGGLLYFVGRVGLKRLQRGLTSLGLLERRPRSARIL